MFIVLLDSGVGVVCVNLTQATPSPFIILHGEGAEGWRGFYKNSLLKNSRIIFMLKLNKRERLYVKN